MDLLISTNVTKLNFSCAMWNVQSIKYLLCKKMDSIAFRFDEKMSSIAVQCFYSINGHTILCALHFVPFFVFLKVTFRAAMSLCISYIHLLVFRLVGLSSCWCKRIFFWSTFFHKWFCLSGFSVEAKFPSLHFSWNNLLIDECWLMNTLQIFTNLLFIGWWCCAIIICTTNSIAPICTVISINPFMIPLNVFCQPFWKFVNMHKRNYQLAD